MPRPLALRYVFFLKPSRANDGTFVMATDTADSAFVLAGPNAEAHTVGDDRDEPLQRAPYALATVIDAYIRARRPLPAPSKERTAVGLPPLMSVKLDLYNAMQAAGITKSELARRLDVHLPQVDRLLDLGHNSRIDQLEAAAEAVGATRVSRCSRAAARCSCRWRRPSSRSALECSETSSGRLPIAAGCLQVGMQVHSQPYLERILLRSPAWQSQSPAGHRSAPVIAAPMAVRRGGASAELLALAPWARQLFGPLYPIIWSHT